MIILITRPSIRPSFYCFYFNGEIIKRVRTKIRAGRSLNESGKCPVLSFNRNSLYEDRETEKDRENVLKRMRKRDKGRNASDKQTNRLKEIRE